jgi:PRTRC genetic system protein E
VEAVKRKEKSMTMFTELYALATTATLAMVMSADEKRGTLTISVMPKPKKDFGEAALTKDLTLTATPAEFDEGFVAALKGYREARTGLVEQAEATKEVLQAAKEAAAKKAAEATTKVSKPTTKPATKAPIADDADESGPEEADGESETATQTPDGVPDGVQPNLFA